MGWWSCCRCCCCQLMLLMLLMMMIMVMVMAITKHSSDLLYLQPSERLPKLLLLPYAWLLNRMPGPHIEMKLTQCFFFADFGGCDLWQGS